MVAGFDGALSNLVTKVSPATIHEVGCGEGYWVMRWLGQAIDARGTDFSTQVIGMAKEDADGRGMDPDRFEVRSIYEVMPERDSADLVVCCEVMEHLEEPQKALQALQRIARSDLILSVPREPLWRMLNLARGKYVSALGNTPGHLQHWSQRGFVSLVSQFFEVVEVLSPLPWTMLHCKPKKRR
ncbi:class I SAM-dependent methyltransferase [Mesorhizobium opportunistum]|uniref:class I SAM-dependent methyltransferase n=1 Tax=Mesorhizobium opportunistum TaxID=593909 RepID=UPI001FD95C5E|nr:class I SAM-dependent methyltransferase [Mesorhizobium opportunistum]